ncbi:hypothetical protein Lalb_Chr21g0311991 [Lupinus albus]|uniref:Uncharacterized protein n=1 Tax=Lupinus albus TaxID=3870 RepID=A0A6A4NFW9_LUPAL|nr:hypothetical protein Lalb_Chr21g0311991 [Lupinus albus]
MNLPYTWIVNHGYMFKWVIIITGVSSTVMFLLIVAYACKKGLVGS